MADSGLHPVVGAAAGMVLRSKEAFFLKHGADANAILVSSGFLEEIKREAGGGITTHIFGMRIIVRANTGDTLFDLIREPETEKPTMSIAECSAENAMLRRDNEELRKFLTAERIENNKLRADQSDLREAIGTARGALLAWIAAETRPCDNEFKSVLDRMGELT